MPWGIAGFFVGTKVIEVKSVMMLIDFFDKR
jgi:hypothetical protein